ncbi:MAG: hypothetical protein AAB419_04345, partial [Pseudomonadota bacterium]
LTLRPEAVEPLHGGHEHGADLVGGDRREDGRPRLDEEVEALLERLRHEDIRLFYAKTPVEFGFVGTLDV